MKTLVLGATGTVGSQVTRGLVARGQAVRVLTRSADKAKSLPAGVEARVGDLTSPRELGPVVDGVDKLFLLNAVSPTETQEGLSALEWARQAGVRKLVYLSVQHVERAPHIPHFGGKFAIETAIRESGLDYTILQPNNFYQNDYWLKDAILSYGVYAQPIGNVGLSRVDVRDIADAAVNALTTDAHRNQTYVLAGPDALTGADCAAAYSRHLGKPVAYMGDDLNAWEQQAITMLPGWMAFDFKIMYRFFQEQGLRATAADLDKMRKAVGHAPRTFDAFVAETVGNWR